MKQKIKSHRPDERGYRDARRDGATSFPHLPQHQKDELVTNCDRLKSLKHSLHPPYAYTEHGIAMLSSVLKSDIAVQVNIHIVRVFVNLRKEINENSILLSRISNIETMLLDHDSKINFLETSYSENRPKSGIFFNNQIFDTYTFSSVLKNTHDRFLIIDNQELYHLGASLKDLGKRWFAFSRMDGFLNEVLARLD